MDAAFPKNDKESLRLGGAPESPTVILPLHSLVPSAEKSKALELLTSMKLGELIAYLKELTPTKQGQAAIESIRGATGRQIDMQVKHVDPMLADPNYLKAVLIKRIMEGDYQESIKILERYKIFMETWVAKLLDENRFTEAQSFLLMFPGGSEKNRTAGNWEAVKETKAGNYCEAARICGELAAKHSQHLGQFRKSLPGAESIPDFTELTDWSSMIGNFPQLMSAYRDLLRILPRNAQLLVGLKDQARKILLQLLEDGKIRIQETVDINLQESLLRLLKDISELGFKLYFNKKYPAEMQLADSKPRDAVEVTLGTLAANDVTVDQAAFKKIAETGLVDKATGKPVNLFQPGNTIVGQVNVYQLSDGRGLRIPLTDDGRSKLLKLAA